MSKETIILIGGGGQCKAAIDVIEEEGKFEIVGIVDQVSKIGQEVLGYKIIGSDDDLPELSKTTKNFFITVGQIESATVRRKIAASLAQLGVTLPTIISPHAYVSKHAQIGAGTIVMHKANVNVGVQVGENCIINSGALIEHDSKVGDFCHISTNSTINGDCIVGNDVFFGSNAVTKQGVSIPDSAFIKANSIVK